jgi:ABC-2 type transport system ATP-binding protein
VSADPQTGPAIRVEGVAFAYGGREALRGVDLVVERGTVHGLLGPNGSGKSTLFKLLSTLVPLQAGRALVLGLDVARQAATIRRRIGVVFQSPAVDKKLTVLENLSYGGRLLGLGGGELVRRCDEALAATGLADRRRDFVGELSGGLRRRVEVAKCLLGRPELMLLDEASTGLDPAARRDLADVLRAQPGLTVLFTTHLMDEAATADRLTLLDDGKVVAEGEPAALMRGLGGQVLEVESDDGAVLAELQAEARQHGGASPVVHERVLRVTGDRVHELVKHFVDRHGARITRLQLAHPSLEDVFFARTGKRFKATPIEQPASKGRRGRRKS